MERFDQVDPAEDAALKRLLFAAALSLLLHGVVVWFVGDRVRDNDAPASQAHVVSPRFAVVGASLQISVAADSLPETASKSPRRPGAISDFETPDPRYYPVEELDEFPVPRQPIRPTGAFPLSGAVRLLTRIDASGRVTDVSIFDSEASGAENSAAIDALRRSAFFAARKQGRAVRSQVVIELAAGAGP
jgi:TonB family protein